MSTKRLSAVLEAEAEAVDSADVAAVTPVEVDVVDMGEEAIAEGTIMVSTPDLTR